MRICNVGVLVVWAGSSLLFACARAEAPAAPAAEIHATLGQVMKGILFPNANVMFAAQGRNPAEVAQAADPSLATDPLASSYGGWEAVENSGLALAEAANLLIIPGRLCSNGRAAPVQNPDWVGFVEELRDAGMTTFQAAQSRNQDSILEAADKVTTACSNCHDTYREKPGGSADRCM